MDDASSARSSGGGCEEVGANPTQRVPDGLDARSAVFDHAPLEPRAPGRGVRVGALFHLVVDASLEDGAFEELGGRARKVDREQRASEGEHLRAVGRFLRAMEVGDLVDDGGERSEREIEAWVREARDLGVRKEAQVLVDFRRRSKGVEASDRLVELLELARDDRLRSVELDQSDQPRRSSHEGGLGPRGDFARCRRVRGFRRGRCERDGLEVRDRVGVGRARQRGDRTSPRGGQRPDVERGRPIRVRARGRPCEPRRGGVVCAAHGESSSLLERVELRTRDCVGIVEVARGRGLDREHAVSRRRARRSRVRTAQDELGPRSSQLTLFGAGRQAERPDVT